MKSVQELISHAVSNGEVSYQHDKDVILIDPITDTLPPNYCYEIFKPLTDVELETLENNYRSAFPEVLKQFYRVSNGMFLFGRMISIFGMPVWAAKYKQPIAIAFADGHRTPGCPQNRLFFGEYHTDPEIQLFFNTENPTEDMPVYAAIYGDNQVIKQWSSFEDWFMSEHDRLLSQYQNGQHDRIDVVPGVLRDINFRQIFDFSDR